MWWCEGIRGKNSKILSNIIFLKAYVTRKFGECSLWFNFLKNINTAQISMGFIKLSVDFPKFIYFKPIYFRFYFNNNWDKIKVLYKTTDYLNKKVVARRLLNTQFIGVMGLIR